MHAPAQNASQYDNDRHGKQRKHRQRHVDVKHETDRRQPEHHGVGQRHHPHAYSHSDIQDVIGGVGHQIPGLCFVEIGGRKRLNV